MKKFFLILFSFFYVYSIYAQTEPLPEKEFTGLNLPITERDWFNFNMGITWYQYQYTDGTLLKYNNVRSIISTVPGNDAVLKEERIWFITNITSFFILGGSFLTLAVYNNRDLPHRDIMLPISASSSLLSLATTVFSNSQWRHTMRKAVNNYNLYIQGIPMR